MHSLENLNVYRLARELAVDVYLMTRTKPLCSHPLLADQIARSAISIPANVAEGYALGTRPQLVRGVRIAYGSAAELKTHFWVAGRAGALPGNEVAKSTAANLERVTGMLVGLLKHYGARVGGL